MDPQILEKAKHFIGRAKVELKNLYFPPRNRCEDVDERKKGRLLSIFALEGCLRNDPDHYIPALINQEILDTALHRSGLDLQDLNTKDEPPCLDFQDLQINCLHGQHRIEAAKIFLSPFDEWWIIDFYAESLTLNIVNYIQDVYANALNYCHGDIYCNLRNYQLKGDAMQANRWLARLHPSMQQDLLRFQKSKEFTGLRIELDKLLAFPGVWPALHIGCLRRIFNLHQPEELTSYVAQVFRTWSNILLNNDALYQNLDYQTVEALQMRNPGQYPEDREFITGAMRQNRMFRLIKDTSSRTLILAQILQIDYEIPSIHTFLEDTKWLEPCADIIRKHLFPKAKGSSYSFLYRNYDFSKGLRIQDYSLEMETHTATRKASFTVAYRQLFMYAWRYFPELSASLPRTAPKKLQREGTRDTVRKLGYIMADQLDAL